MSGYQQTHYYNPEQQFNLINNPNPPPYPPKQPKCIEGCFETTEFWSEGKQRMFKKCLRCQNLVFGEQKKRKFEPPVPRPAIFYPNNENHPPVLNTQVVPLEPLQTENNELLEAILSMLQEMNQRIAQTNELLKKDKIEK